MIRDWGRAKVKCELSEAAQADAQLLEVARLGQTGQPCLLACQVCAGTVECLQLYALNVKALRGRQGFRVSPGGAEMAILSLCPRP